MIVFVLRRSLSVPYSERIGITIEKILTCIPIICTFIGITNTF